MCSSRDWRSMVQCGPTLNQTKYQMWSETPRPLCGPRLSDHCVVRDSQTIVWSETIRLDHCVVRVLSDHCVVRDYQTKNSMERQRLPHGVLDIVRVEGDEEAEYGEKHNSIGCHNQTTGSPLNLKFNCSRHLHQNRRKNLR